MRIGLQDVRHFAIIAGAGGVGLVATILVYSAIRGPDTQYPRGVTIEFVKTHGHVVVEPPGMVVDPTSGELRAWVGWKRKPGRMGFGRGIAYPKRLGMDVEEKPVLYVDGVRVGSVHFLRPEDIEKIEVFKGLQAKQRFGHEGERGVIEVVTKSGKSAKSGKKDWPDKKEDY